MKKSELKELWAAVQAYLGENIAEQLEAEADVVLNEDNPGDELVSAFKSRMKEEVMANQPAKGDEEKSAEYEEIMKTLE